MEYSQETEAILAYLDQYSNNALRKRNDIGVLLETGSQLGAAEEFNHLVFIGRVVWNVYLSLRKAGPGAEGYQILQKEFASSIEQLREHLLPFVAHVPEEVQRRFESVYLGLDDGTLRNLVDLSHDLGILKAIQSEQRRQ